jgi:hypothetical protein
MTCSAAGFCGPDFCFIFASFDGATMNQKSSLLNYPASVSRALMADRGAHFTGPSDLKRYEYRGFIK